MGLKVDEAIELTKDAIHSILTNNVVVVTFTKKDGEERVMKCTLNENLLPPKDPDVKPKKKSEDVIAVWDLDKSAWRSFRYDSVKHLEFGLTANEEYEII